MLTYILTYSFTYFTYFTYLLDLLTYFFTYLLTYLLTYCKVDGERVDERRVYVEDSNVYYSSRIKQ